MRPWTSPPGGRVSRLWSAMRDGSAAARAAGVDHLLRTENACGTADRQIWIACTDADSAVPVEWLRLQLHHARSGVELALGTVAPDPQELAAGILAAWRLRHLVIDGHPHVHGANLGIRADTYRAAGGFQDVAAHEDVLLGIAVRATGARVISTAAGPVLTSGRTQGRAPLGMAPTCGSWRATNCRWRPDARPESAGTAVVRVEGLLRAVTGPGRTRCPRDPPAR